MEGSVESPLHRKVEEDGINNNNNNNSDNNNNIIITRENIGNLKMIALC